MRRFDDPAWWDEQARQHGATPASADYSKWTHSRRLAAICRVLRSRGTLSTLSVIDVPCGTGQLPRTAGWFGRYVGVDWSSGAAAECEAAMVTQPDGRVLVADLTAPGIDVALSALGPFDAVVSCGWLCFAHLFAGERDAVAWLARARAWTRLGGLIVANLPCASRPQGEGIRPYDREALAAECSRAGLTCRIETDYLPHEFLAVVTA